MGPIEIKNIIDLFWCSLIGPDILLFIGVTPAVLTAKAILTIFADEIPNSIGTSEPWVPRKNMTAQYTSAYLWQLLESSIIN